MREQIKYTVEHINANGEVIEAESIWIDPERIDMWLRSGAEGDASCIILDVSDNPFADFIISGVAKDRYTRA